MSNSFDDNLLASLAAVDVSLAGSDAAANAIIAERQRLTAVIAQKDADYAALVKTNAALSAELARINALPALSWPKAITPNPVPPAPTPQPAWVDPVWTRIDCINGANIKASVEGQRMPALFVGDTAVTCSAWFNANTGLAGKKSGKLFERPALRVNGNGFSALVTKSAGVFFRDFEIYNRPANGIDLYPGTSGTIIRNVWLPPDISGMGLHASQATGVVIDGLVGLEWTKNFPILRVGPTEGTNLINSSGWTVSHLVGTRKDSDWNCPLFRWAGLEDSEITDCFLRASNATSAGNVMTFSDAASGLMGAFRLKLRRGTALGRMEFQSKTKQIDFYGWLFVSPDWLFNLEPNVTAINFHQCGFIGKSLVGSGGFSPFSFDGCFGSTGDTASGITKTDAATVRANIAGGSATLALAQAAGIAV